MDIFGNLLGAGASALSGGLFGLAGNVAAKLFGYFETEQSATHRQAEWNHEIELLKLQQAIRPESVEHDRAPASPSSDSMDILRDSIRADAALSGSYSWVNAVRSLVRPTLTLGLTAFLGAAFFVMPESAAEKSYVVDSLMFASVTAIVWWFGDRAPRRTLPH
jgi:hypothetical protein